MEIVDRRQRFLKIAKQAVVQSINPTMNAQLFAGRPGGSDDWCCGSSPHLQFNIQLS